MPEIDQNIGGTRPTTFSADRTTLLVKLDQLARCTRVVVPHPIFGPMSRSEWMRWGYLHTDHHLRQFGR
jgi:hypothetical protein